MKKPISEGRIKNQDLGRKPRSGNTYEENDIVCLECNGANSIFRNCSGEQIKSLDSCNKYNNVCIILI